VDAFGAPADHDASQPRPAMKAESTMLTGWWLAQKMSDRAI
jgi:hypothetical protein